MTEFLQNFELKYQIAIIYFLIINIITFFAFRIDKMKSRKQHASRLSEKSLWILSLIGGSIGALWAMNYFRHKTKKLSFQAGMAVVLMLQLGILYFIFYI